MSVEFQYEELLAHYSNHLSAIELLKHHRPYFELVPSIRRSHESLIAVPLPVVQVCRGRGVEQKASDTTDELIHLPCDIALLMCDPEWKIKTGIEIFVLIHRPGEKFSQLLSRWRQTQVLLSRGYEWQMPPHYKHILGESAEQIYPLFVLFEATSEQIKRGLRGACLPFAVEAITASEPQLPALEFEEPEENLGSWGKGRDRSG